MKRRDFLCRAGRTLSVTALGSMAAHGSHLFGNDHVVEPTCGPLRIHPHNKRYFADSRGRAVLLTGSHTWNNLVDMGKNDPPKPFDYSAYLDFLARYGHNFVRLWTWDTVTWDTRANGHWGKDFVHHVSPHPWKRVGPSKALDGKPRFDLKQFDPEYFKRLRQRVDAARRRGIYVSIMLFEGWSLRHGNRRRGVPDGWAWRGHPFHPANNVNGIDAGDKRDRNTGSPHSLDNPRVNQLQTAYIRKVVDTVNDLDNVLFEVINEGGEVGWDWWVVTTLRNYEKTKPKQHPIGITGHGAEGLRSMLASPADWISPGSKDGFRDDPPAWNSNKVSILDTDHVWGIGGNGQWVWKAFLRGHNPIFMDPYDGSVLAKRFDKAWDPIRRNMGFVRNLASRVDLANLIPADRLASSRYCLTNRDSTFLVLAPAKSEVTVDLSLANGPLKAEWIDCNSNQRHPAKPVPGGRKIVLKSPFASDSILFLNGAHSR